MKRCSHPLLLALYYSAICASTLYGLHCSALLQHSIDGQNGYHLRLGRRLLFLTNIGCLLNSIYAFLRLISILKSKVSSTQQQHALSPAMETFFRQVLSINMIVVIAYWGMVAVNPRLVQSK